MKYIEKIYRHPALLTYLAAIATDQTTLKRHILKLKISFIPGR